MEQKRIEEIKVRANRKTGDLGFANGLEDAMFAGWYKQDVPELVAEIERLQKERDAYKQVLGKTVEKDCNTCASKSTCEHAPKIGEYVRCNCFLWRGLED